MDRRRFVSACSAAAACAHFVDPAFAADALPTAYEQVLLADEQGHPLRAGALRSQVNYVFCYPFVATPVFLLDIGRRVPARTVGAAGGADGYLWPGGVGSGGSIVAYAAICTHRLVYPTREVNFIGFRRDRARQGVQDGLIHCCADNSQYDPRQGAAVVAGPAPRPLTAVLLTHDAQADTLTAYATLGADIYEEFFQRYAAKLSLEVGPTARNAVRGQAVVMELEKYTRNSMRC